MPKRILLIALFMAPVFAAAQGVTSGGSNGNPLENTLGTVTSVVSTLTKLAMPVALVAFFYGLIKFISAGDSQDIKKEGKKIMINGGVALFLMVGIWSVIGYVQNSIGLTGRVDVGTTPEFNVIPGQRI